ncbi:hypothetical protein V6N12_032093 [Hibiscus sabdariffa]|uniref:Uncharacterized protein n=1 Tax=Hibiscus sabdariffa TaxID=183260 RepID=A0ABR1ZP27_9ROSI
MLRCSTVSLTSFILYNISKETSKQDTAVFFVMARAKGQSNSVTRGSKSLLWGHSFDFFRILDLRLVLYRPTIQWIKRLKLVAGVVKLLCRDFSFRVLGRLNCNGVNLWNEVVMD